MTKIKYLLPFLGLMFAIGVASAQPANIVSYYPVYLNNTQTSATPAPFQAMIVANLSTMSNITYSSSFSNIEFYYPSNNTIIPSWIESNSSGNLTIWLNISAGIPASTNETVYMGLSNNATNMLNNVNTGEAPQLSPSYAEYDDGASVFSYYQRWGGLSALPSGWTATGVSATLNAQSTTIYATTNGTRGAIVSSFPISATPFILETYGLFYDSGLAINFEYGLFGSSTPNTDLDYTLVFAQATTGDVGVYNPAISSGVYNYAQATANSIQGIALASTTSIFTYQNYQLGYSNSALTASSFSYLQYGSESTTIPLNIYWTRVRAYPPNGVMPSVSFGAVQLSVSLSISPNPSTYGQSVTLTATCPIGAEVILNP